MAEDSKNFLDLLDFPPRRGLADPRRSDENPQLLRNKIPRKEMMDVLRSIKPAPRKEMPDISGGVDLVHQKELLEIQHDLGVLVKHLDAYDDKDAVQVKRSVPVVQGGMLEHVAMIRAVGEKHAARRRGRRRSYYYLLQAWAVFAVGAVMLLEWGSSIPRDNTGLGFLAACLLLVVLIPLWVILWDGRDYTSQHQDLLKIVESANSLQNTSSSLQKPPLPHPPTSNLRSLRQIKILAESVQSRLASTLRQSQALQAPKEQHKPPKIDAEPSKSVL